MSQHFAKIAPHIVALLIFFVVTFLFFKPEFMESKALRQDDMLKYKGMVEEVAQHYRETGEVSMWSGSMFGGMPAYMIYPVFEYGALPAIESILRGFIAEKKGAHLLFLSMVSLYILLLSFKVRPILAAAGGLAFALTSYNVILIDVGHVTKLWALCYGAILLAGMRLMYDDKKYLGFALAALGMALEMKAAHFQVTYYLAFVCAFYGLSELVFAVKEGQLPRFAIHSGLLVVAVALGTATSAGKLMTTLEYSPHTIRGKALLSAKDSDIQGEDGLDKEYAFSWSQGKMECFTLLVPYFYGGGSQELLGPESATYRAVYGPKPAPGKPNIALPTYWGDQSFTAGPVYAGAIICFLFVLGLFIVEPRQRYWILAGAVFMMMLSWGKNFDSLNYFLFDYFPGFNKFRAVSMALSLTVLLMILLAVVALERALQEGWTPEMQKKGKLTVGIVGGLLGIFILFGSSMFDFRGPGDARFEQILQFLVQDRQDIFQSDALRGLVLISLTVGVYYFGSIRKIPMWAASLGIAALITGDLFFVAKRYLNYDKFQKNVKQQEFTVSKADKFILSDPDEPGYRVLNMQNPFNDSRTSYFHRSVGGYFAAKMRRYQDLIENRLQPEMQQVISRIQDKSLDMSNDSLMQKTMPVINMMNTRYLKFGDKSGRDVLLNPNAQGAAWFVEEIKTVKSPDESMASLAKEDLTRVAVVNSTDFDLAASKFNVDSAAQITLKEYEPNRLLYSYTNSQPGFAVFSEVYYPHGWEVLLDGQPLEGLVRVNYTLRGLKLPAGEHKLEFRFNSASFEQGNTLTELSSHLVLLVLVLALGFSVWKAFRQPANDIK